MHKKQILLSFDIEEFDVPVEYGRQIAMTDRLRISGLGFADILTLLKKLQIRATFFCTVKIAEAFPALIQQLSADGHEMASHGMEHSAFDGTHLAQSAERLAALSGQKIVGFRMPRLAFVEPQELLTAGFEYDSSINPVFLPGRYNHRKLPLTAYKEVGGLWQIPISAVPWVRFPLFWLSFKNLPLPLYCIMAEYVMNKTGVFNLYTHPWEYRAEAAQSEWGLPRYMVRHAGAEQLMRLEKLIKYLKPSGDFITFKEYVKGLNEDKN